MEGEEDEDAALQYMIEQSLLESHKQRETNQDSGRGDSSRSVQQKLGVKIHEKYFYSCALS